MALAVHERSTREETMQMNRWIPLALAVALVVGMGNVAKGQAERAAPGPAGVAATVNSAPILLAELEAVIKSAGPGPLHASEASRRQQQIEALGVLIDRALMRQFLARNTTDVTPAEVERRLSELEAGLKPAKTLAEFCFDTHQTLDQLKTSVAEHIRWTSYAAKIVTPTKVKEYYDRNRDFFDGTAVKASHIVIRLAPGASEKDLAKAREKLQDLRAKLVSDPKADFAGAARQYSQDSHSKQGGELGWFPRKWVYEEEFSQAAFALPVGGISDVVQTSYGLHVIKVTDKKQGERSDFAKIKEAVREMCIEDLRQHVLAEEHKKAKIEIHLP